MSALALSRAQTFSPSGFGSHLLKMGGCQGNPFPAWVSCVYALNVCDANTCDTGQSSPRSLRCKLGLEVTGAAVMKAIRPWRPKAVVAGGYYRGQARPTGERHTFSVYYITAGLNLYRSIHSVYTLYGRSPDLTLFCGTSSAFLQLQYFTAEKRHCGAEAAK